MLKKVEKTAKNLDEALAQAAADLGAAKDELGYEITREVGKGFMRLLVTPEIDITAWVAADAEKEAALDAAKAAKAEKSEKTEKAAKAEKAEKPAAKPADAPAAKKAEPKRNEKSEIKKPEPKKTPSAPKRAKEVPDDFIMPKSAVDDAKYFVSELLTKIGLTYELNVKIDANVITLDVSGEKMGLLIGKRGDTLDAIQMLAGLYVNRNKSNPYIKVNIDTENYRKKREETLVRLAHGLARSVIRDKKSVTLEPMTANERRIIHSALQNNPKIKTYSVGEEPNRRMVVSLRQDETEE